MNPINARPQDWRLYYNGTWMLHETLGVVRVSVDEQTLYIRGVDEEPRRHTRCHPRTLSCLWPEPRSINHGGNAMYVGRRGRREARRSATSHHYYIVWDELYGGPITNTMITKLVVPQDYPTIEAAIASIEDERTTSVAVSRDIIIARENLVVYKGIASGTLEHDNYQYWFRPSIGGSPLAKRAAFKLAKEGILCR